MLSLSDKSVQPDFFSQTLLSQKKTAINWRISTAEDRIVRLKKIQTWIKEHQKDIQLSLLADFQKPPTETDLSEIFTVTSEINHAGQASQVMDETQICFNPTSYARDKWHYIL